MIWIRPSNFRKEGNKMKKEIVIPLEIKLAILFSLIAIILVFTNIFIQNDIVSKCIWIGIKDEDITKI